MLVVSLPLIMTSVLLHTSNYGILVDELIVARMLYVLRSDPASSRFATLRPKHRGIPAMSASVISALLSMSVAIALGSPKRFESRKFWTSRSCSCEQHQACDRSCINKSNDTGKRACLHVREAHIHIECQGFNSQACALGSSNQTAAASSEQSCMSFPWRYRQERQTCMPTQTKGRMASMSRIYSIFAQARETKDGVDRGLDSESDKKGVKSTARSETLIGYGSVG